MSSRSRIPLRYALLSFSVFFTLFLVGSGAGGCALMELDDAVEDAIEQCEEIAERERVSIVEQCDALLQEQVDAFQEWIEELLSQKKDEIFEGLGCTRDETEAGWDCSYSVICRL